MFREAPVKRPFEPFVPFDPFALTITGNSQSIHRREAPPENLTSRGEYGVMNVFASRSPGFSISVKSIAEPAPLS